LNARRRNQQEKNVRYVSPEKRVPATIRCAHPQEWMDEILRKCHRSREVILRGGGPSIAPERLFRSLLLQIFYSVRSERMLIEQLQYNLLFGGLWGWKMTRRSGITRCSARIGSVAERGNPESFFQRVLDGLGPYVG